VIVVGVDGSEPSRRALRWAARQARLTGASLHAVLGSVSQYCSQHAPCPVVIVRADDERPREAPPKPSG